MTSSHPSHHPARPRPARRRFRSLLLTALAIVLCGAAGLTALWHSQGGRLQQLLLDELQQRSGVQLRFASAQLTLRSGPGLELRQIELALPALGLRLQSPRLQLHLDGRSLLRGEIHAGRLHLHQPDIYWQPPAAGVTTTAKAAEPVTAAPVPAPTAHPSDQLWQEYQQRLAQLWHHRTPWQHLQIDQGRLRLADSPWVLQFDRLNLASAQTTGWLQLQAKGHIGRTGQNSSAGRWQLNGQLHASADRDPLRLHVQLDGFDSGQLPAMALAGQPLRSQGAVHLDLDLHSPDPTALALQLRVQPDRSQNIPTLQWGERAPLPLQRVQINGLWQAGQHRLQLRQIELHAGPLQLQASGSWQPDSQQLQLQLHSQPLSLASLQPWLAPATTSPWPAWLDGAQLHCHQLELAGCLRQSLTTLLQRSRWSLQLPAFAAVTAANTALELHIEQQGPHWQLHSNPLRYRTTELDLQGPLQLQLHPADTARQWQLQLDLTAAQLDLARIVRKAPGATASASASLRLPADDLCSHLDALLANRAAPPSGDTSTADWQLQDGRLQLDDLDLRFNGHYRQKHHWQLQLQLPSFALERLARRFDLLELMELRGPVALDYRLRRNASGLHGQGQLRLNGCAIAPARILAPLHQIHGTIHLNDWQAHCDPLDLLLGEGSPLRLRARIADLRAPVADIRTVLTQMPASDLIFNSRQAQLHDLIGHLRIHARGIDFVDARVRLAQGTQARVQGTLLFAGPDMDLNIDADYGNIDEVIALWHDRPVNPPESAPQASLAGPGNSTTPPVPEILPEDETLRLHCHVARGIFRGFSFSDANALLHIQPGQLRLEPLQFHADGGHGDARLIVRLSEPHAHLFVDGRVQRLRAGTIYQQLFDEQGLVSGKLTSAFRLQGPLTGQFRQQALGEVSLQIKDGVLRRFRTLSRAFSLLNVAQLFRFQLPDMAREGMPFNQLGATIQLGEGRLHSENLLIESDAMNLAVAGDYQLTQQELDLLLAISPLGTVDSLLSRVPVAGWLLTGSENRLVTVHFAVSGPVREPEVEMLPLDSVSTKLIDILRRTIDLPATLIHEPRRLLFNRPDNATKP